MKTRVLTSILIILVVLFPVYFGGWSLKLLGVFIMITGSYEMLRALSGFKEWGMLVLPIVIVWIVGMYFITAQYLLAYWIAGAVIIWSLPVFMPSYTQSDCMNTLAFMLIFGLAWLSMIRLIPVHQYLWTLCFTTYGSDTGAYFFGRFFGRHKMIERISPKKTWEGFFGGCLTGFLLSFVVSMLCLKDLNFTMNLLICILAPAFAELGDLCFSSFKREHQMKDFSNILPGHGGILDRVDSLMMNFLLFGILSCLF